MNQRLALRIYRLVAYLRREDTFRYLETYMQSQWWDRSQLSTYHCNKLAEVLAYAYTSIPYYQNLRDAKFNRLPIITKSHFRDVSNFLTNSDFVRFAHKKTTGGSTGEPITILKDSESMAREQAATLRGYGWAGINPGDTQARFWGIPHKTKHKILCKVTDVLLNRKRFSAFNYTEQRLDMFYQKLIKYRPTYIYGYVSMVNDFANFIKETKNGIDTSFLKAIITTSEILTAETKNNIEATFNARVFNEYGCGEVGTIAHECIRGLLHVNCENLYVEICDDNGNVLSEGTGRIIVTELHNKVHQLIRYDLGDYGEVSTQSCECGRGLLVLKNIHGRAYDLIIGPNNRKYHPEFFIYIFEDINKKQIDAIKQFQLIQNQQELTINLIKGKNFHPKVEGIIRNALKREFQGYFTCRFNYVDRLARERSGKLRVVKREI